jgi:hypothetical protein
MTKQAPGSLRCTMDKRYSARRQKTKGFLPVPQRLLQLRACLTFRLLTIAGLT